MSLSATQQRIDDAVGAMRAGVYRLATEPEARYSRKQIRELVSEYPSLGLDRWTERREDEAGAPVSDVASELEVIAHADLTAAFEALRRWELTWPAWGLRRSVGIVWTLMEGRPKKQVSRALMVRDADLPRLVEEGLEFLYLYLDGRPPEYGSIRLPESDAWGLADLWTDIVRDTAA